MVGIEGPSLCSVQKCRQDYGLVHVQFAIQLEAVAILHGFLQPAKCLSGFGDPVGNLDADSGAVGSQAEVCAPGGEEVHAPLHVHFGRGVERAVVGEEQAVDRGRMYPRWGLHAPAVEKMPVSFVHDEYRGSHHGRHPSA
nr:unnamed protein product [Spirometra erinaceieuropaei]